MLLVMFIVLLCGIPLSKNYIVTKGSPSAERDILDDSITLREKVDVVNGKEQGDTVTLTPIHVPVRF